MNRPPIARYGVGVSRRASAAPLTTFLLSFHLRGLDTRLTGLSLLLPALGGDYFARQVSLANNDSARFEDRWVTLAVNPDSPCIFTKGLDRLELPVRHGEGKLVPMEPAVLDELRR